MRRAVVACATLLLLTPACITGPSRVGQGMLYASGNPTYDAFFRDVHQEQVDASGWGDDKKAARRSLVTSLDLPLDAADVTVVQAAHESSSKVARQPGSVKLDVDGTTAHVVAPTSAGDAGGLFKSVEDAAHLELERAKRLHGFEPKLDALVKQGGELESHVKGDFSKYGETKSNEVATELMASVDVLAKLKAQATAEARASEDFVADLERALETASEDKVARREATKKKHRAPDDGAPRAPKAAAASADQPAAPKPAAQKPAEPGEVFTP